MTGEGEAQLTFPVLDGLAFAAERGRLGNRSREGSLTVNELGPLLELMQIEAGGLTMDLLHKPSLVSSDMRPIYAALKNNHTRWICPKTRHQGFFRIGSGADSETPWIEFKLAMQQAAIAAGFKRQVAAQLVGALGELHDNIHEHSRAPQTGLASFNAIPGGFEFVVTDQGVGVLQSLTSCPEYSGVKDHGDALRLALADGVSRYGSDKDRGRGFRPLFIGLANLSGSLRFRSGDHALIIDGKNPNLMTAKLAQKARLNGFLVSVSYR